MLRSCQGRNYLGLFAVGRAESRWEVGLDWSAGAQRSESASRRSQAGKKVPPTDPPESRRDLDAAARWGSDVPQQAGRGCEATLRTLFNFALTPY